MKAIIWTKYGSPDVLQLREVEKPTPKDNEVLIKIHATTVTAGDCEIRAFKTPIEFWLIARLMFGIFRPKRKPILGQELAGEIESIGNNVTRFKVGDYVYGGAGLGLGSYAEYKCLPEDGVLVKKPDSMTFEEAAAVPLGGQNALFFLRMGNIKKGDKVLIHGASGSFGTFAVQIARYFGAEVTAVCSQESFELMRYLGASKVIDYKKEVFPKNGGSYDIIFDPLGFSPYSQSRRALKKKGYYLLASPRLPQKIRGMWSSITSGKKVITAMTEGNSEDLIFLNDLIKAGKIKTVIDRTYPLDKIVDAHKYVEKREKIGNVVITVIQ